MRIWIIPNRIRDLDLAEKSPFDFPGQADDGRWPALRLAWQSQLPFPPSPPSAWAFEMPRS